MNKQKQCAVFTVLLALVLPCLAENAVVAEVESFAEIKLGPALEVPEGLFSRRPSVRAVPSTNTGGWSIDSSNRQQVRNFFNSVHQASENTPIEWTGDQVNCTAGTTAAGFKDAVLARINYFRAMAGVPAGITFRSDFNARSQAAALIMSANRSLSHNPPVNWDCYSDTGRQGASSSNLSLGNIGWNAVSSQMLDRGSNNTQVGHRYWLLLPQTEEMGTGDVPAKNGFLGANSVTVFDGRQFEPWPTLRDGFVAWPTKGFNPYPIVPVRWSFVLRNADFSSATVQMTKNGQPVSTTIEYRSASRIVWIPDGFVGNSKPAADTTYEVTINDVIVSGVVTNFSYPVTVFDPQAMADNEEVATISGVTSPPIGVISNFDFTTVTGAQRYDALIAETADATDQFDAEDNGVTVTDRTGDSYELFYSGGFANGTTVYRLAPQSSAESFDLEGVFIPSIDSEFIFDSRLGFATTRQTAAIQISVDDGGSWRDVFTQTGSGNGNDTSFVAHTVSLAEYSDKLVRFRVIYRFGRGSHFVVGQSANTSFLVDNLRITHAEKVTHQTIVDAGNSPSFSLTAQNTNALVLSVRPVMWLGYPASEWGPLFNVNPDIAPSFNWDIDGDGQTKFTSDGIIIIRYLFGFRGAALVNGAVGLNASRDTAAIEQYLSDNRALMDIDLDGDQRPLSDGLLIIRFFAGFSGETLIRDAVNPLGQRIDADEVLNYLEGYQ